MPSRGNKARPEVDIKPAEDVLEQKWYALDGLPGPYISPSTGNIVDKLSKLLTRVK